MPVAATTKTRRDVAFTISDGTGTPKTFTPVLQQGDFNFTQNYSEEIAIMANGVRKGLRKGDDPTIDATGGWTELFALFTDATDGSVQDLANLDGKFAAAATTATAGGGYDADFVLYDIVLTVEGTDHGDSTDHTATFSDCRIMMTQWQAAKEGCTYGASWNCYGGVVYTGES